MVHTHARIQSHTQTLQVCLSNSLVCCVNGGRGRGNTCAVPNPLKSAEQTARPYFSLTSLTLTPYLHKIASEANPAQRWPSSHGRKHVPIKWMRQTYETYVIRCNNVARARVTRLAEAREVTWAEKECVTEWQLPQVSVFQPLCCVTLVYCDYFSRVVKKRNVCSCSMWDQ